MPNSSVFIDAQGNNAAPDNARFVEQLKASATVWASDLATRRMVYEKVKPLITDKCPFVNLPETGGEILDAEKVKQCVWVRPKLVAVIEFLEWTEGDRLRHSKFVGLRDDKNPREVVKEA
jgi:ATP-dependent DNA ligase